VDKPRILVVDDDPNMLLLIRYNLEQRGLAVTSAGDGPEGLRLATEEPFDLIILDVMLPGFSGFELCARLRETERGRDVPVLLLTARSQAGDFEQASRAGATDYVLKPFDPVALAEQVEATVRARAGTDS
jgi:DNA-binding response OmpR family regulator